MTAPVTPERPSGAARGPLPAWLDAPARFVADRWYGAVVRRRNARFDNGSGIVTLDRPVISVGNLSVGGTGKTPAVTRIVESLLAIGRRPCIASRGYGKGQHRGDRADEVLVYRDRFPGVPVVARPDRVEGLIELFHAADGDAVDVVVLDDGFQHRRLARQMDLVLLDASRPFTRDRMLPAGWLREPDSALARATHLLLTHTERARPADLNAMRARVDEIARPVMLGDGAHRWTDVVVHPRGGGQRAVHGPAWLGARDVVALCGLGQPGPFLRQADASCRSVRASVVLPDHAAYTPKEVARLRDAIRSTGAGLVLTTAKDWVKLRERLGDLPACEVAVPTLGLEISGGAVTLEDAVRGTLEAFDAE